MVKGRDAVNVRAIAPALTPCPEMLSLMIQLTGYVC